MQKLLFCRKAARCGIVIAAVMALSLAGLCVVAQHSPTSSVGSFEETKAQFKSSEALILDRHGEPLQLSRVRFNERRISWVPLDEIPRDLVGMLVVSEDRRFYEHHGVDWKALFRAASYKVRGGSRQGGSTITMQLASLISNTNGWRRGFWDKLEQIRLARKMESSWSKAELLEAYLNLAPFKGELRGLAAAAQNLFGKDPHGLTSEESAVLIAMLRSPNATPDMLEKRACAVLRWKGEPSPCDGLGAVTAMVFAPSSGRMLAEAAAPLAARELIKQAQGAGVIHSTIDGRMQREVADLLKAHLLPLRDKNAQDAAILIVDNQSGEILSYVGNGGESSSARYVDGIRSRRSAGSTLKPFLYAAALENRLVTAESLLDDAPLNLTSDNGVYRPEDYDHTFRGPVTVRTALASSLNIPAVEMLKLLGVENFATVLRNVGIPPGKASKLYGYSMALGTPAVSLKELVTGYRTLARGGIFGPLYLNQNHPTPEDRRVLSPEASFIVADILSDRESRATTFGLENPLSTRFWSAAKTGTSRDMTDNWCVGFTQRYTVGVWVGNFSGAPMWNVTGITGAAPIWVDAMNLLVQHYGGDDLGAPKAPTGLRGIAREGREEWFLPGTEPAPLVEQRAALGVPRIEYPAQGMVVALDPEVSEDRQKIRFRAHSRLSGVSYHMDGTLLGPVTTAVWWKVSKGKHTLQLRGSDDTVFDSVSFLVR